MENNFITQGHFEYLNIKNLAVGLPYAEKHGVFPFDLDNAVAPNNVKSKKYANKLVFGGLFLIIGIVIGFSLTFFILTNKQISSTPPQFTTPTINKSTSVILTTAVTVTNIPPYKTTTNTITPSNTPSPSPTAINTSTVTHTPTTRPTHTKTLLPTNTSIIIASASPTKKATLIVNITSTPTAPASVFTTSLNLGIIIRQIASQEQVLLSNKSDNVEPVLVPDVQIFGEAFMYVENTVFYYTYNDDDRLKRSASNIAKALGIAEDDLQFVQFTNKQWFEMGFSPSHNTWTGINGDFSIIAPICNTIYKLMVNLFDVQGENIGTSQFSFSIQGCSAPPASNTSKPPKPTPTSGGISQTVTPSPK